MITLLFDTETTGLLLPRTAELNKQPRIIELACIRVENGNVVSEHSWLIDPERKLSAEITKITGLTDADLEGKPKFRQLLPEIEDVFAGCDVLLAHNAPFDVGMMTTELLLCERTGFPWPKETVCTVQEYMHLKGRRLKMTQLYEIKMGKKLEQTHRALDDVRALVEICVKEGIV